MGKRDCDNTRSPLCRQIVTTPAHHDVGLPHCHSASRAADKKRAELEVLTAFPRGSIRNNIWALELGRRFLPLLPKHSPCGSKNSFLISMPRLCHQKRCRTHLLIFFNLSPRAPEQWQISDSGCQCGPEILEIQSGMGDIE